MVILLLQPSQLSLFLSDRDHGDREELHHQPGDWALSEGQQQRRVRDQAVRGELGPIRSQYCGYVINIDQSEASIVILIARCSLTPGQGQGREGQSG